MTNYLAVGFYQGQWKVYVRQELYDAQRDTAISIHNWLCEVTARPQQQSWIKSHYGIELYFTWGKIIFNTNADCLHLQSRLNDDELAELL